MSYYYYYLEAANCLKKCFKLFIYCIYCIYYIDLRANQQWLINVGETFDAVQLLSTNESFK